LQVEHCRLRTKMIMARCRRLMRSSRAVMEVKMQARGSFHTRIAMLGFQ